MTTVKDIYTMMDAWAPFDSAEDFDNVGLLIGDGEMEVSGIVIALDATKEIIEEAKGLGANLIITHHPVLFDAMKSINPTDAQGKLVTALIRSGIAVISAHTNLDAAPRGISHMLAEAVGLKDIEAVEGNPLLYEGVLDAPVSAEAFAKEVKEAVGAEVVTICGPVPVAIRRVVVAGGRADSFLMDAVRAESDLFLLGEIRHEYGLAAQTMGQCVMAAGHYETEAIILDRIKGYLQKKLFDVQLESCIKVTAVRTGPFSTIG